MIEKDLRHKILEIRGSKKRSDIWVKSSTRGFTLTAKQSGFTLIELLVILGLFAVLAVVLNQVLFSTFKGAAKTEASEKSKREADRAMGVIERSLRNARVIYSCSSSVITYQDQYGETTSFSCNNIGSNAGYIASGSANLTANDVSVTACSISCENINGINKAVLISASFASRSTANTERIEEQGTITLQSRILLRN